LSLLSYFVESNRNVEDKDLQILNGNIKDIKMNSVDRNFSTPIVPKGEGSWEVLKNPERLRKTYSFESAKACQYFFSELYKHQFVINHHCKIIIDNLDVTVITYTHGFEGVTDMDKKIKKYCDELESDLNYFKN
jgi:pterin-4a-carbinolamine dehydratase